LLAALKAAQVRSIRDWAMILTGYKHALRASEIAALTLDDLHDGCLDIKRKKESLHTIWPLFPHKGEPLLDEGKALRARIKSSSRRWQQGAIRKPEGWSFKPRAGSPHIQVDL